MAEAIRCTSAGSHVAAKPIAWGNTVARPLRAAPLVGFDDQYLLGIDFLNLLSDLAMPTADTNTNITGVIVGGKQMLHTNATRRRDFGLR
jgi:hypothetical protein